MSENLIKIAFWKQEEHNLRPDLVNDILGRVSVMQGRQLSGPFVCMELKFLVIQGKMSSLVIQGKMGSIKEKSKGYKVEM